MSATSPSSVDESPITADELVRIRASIPAIERCTYLNAGTLGPIPTASIDAMAVVSDYDHQQRQCISLWEKLVEHQDEARAAVASITGSTTEHVALMHSTHEGINTCLWGLDVSAEHSIITTDEEHPGVLVPLRHVASRTGVDVRIAPWLHDGDDSSWVARVLEQVDGSTRAVVVSHVSWVSGAFAPLRMLAKALPNDVRLIVDGAQSAGIVPVDPADGWHAYTVSGQKWPCGPNGSGGLVLTDPEAWLPTFGGFMQVTDPAACMTSPLQIDGRRFETSQEAMVPLAGFAASARWITDDIGIARAAAHARAMNSYARSRLMADVPAAACMRGDAHLLCMDVPAGSAEGVVAALSAERIVIRNLGPDTLRVSFGAWTSSGDVDRCVDAMAAALAT